MGYQTYFDGEIKISPPLNLPEYQFLKKFSEERHEDGNYPGIWCDFEPNEEGTEIAWNESEKTYKGAEWVQYLIENFLAPDAHAKESDDPVFKHFQFNHVCNGVIEADGEDSDDRWNIIVENNVVQVQEFAYKPVGERLDV
jgi:hypothetical protein